MSNKMTQGFDEWYNDPQTEDFPSLCQAYSAGAASRQAEIDDQFRANCKQTDHIHKLQHERDELQKRINLALAAVWDDELSHIVIDILKGENNE